ncbi:MAG: 50S ribosomal protein L24 [Beggiatoa sp. IS2]|nr:MAG: 50S ribosomal protein L24 [Beggiatoa sp. IS2]
MQRIRKGDDIIVIAGKEKNKRGKIIRMIGKEKVLVENVNLVKRHTKGNPLRNTSGSIVDKEMPLHISNVAVINPTTDKADKVGFKFLEDGTKVRFFKSTGEVFVD